LDDGVELVAEVDRARLHVVVEEVGDCDVEVIGHLIFLTHGKIKDRWVDGGVELALNGVVGLLPDRIIKARRHRCVEEGEEAELAHHGFEEGGPTVEVWPSQLQGDRHVRFDIDGAKRVEDGRCVVGDERAGREDPVGC
jgi:hypothetical protein